MGTYPIENNNLSAGANYTVTFIPSNLTVNPASLTVKPTAVTKQYGSGALPPISYTVTGFVNDDTLDLVTGDLATSATSTSNAGVYPITIGTLAAGSNYLLSLTPASVTITPAPLTVTANSLSTRDGGAIPPLTFKATGFVNGDTQGILSGVTLSTTATADSPAGVYPITISGGSATNYTVTTVNGTLTLTLSNLLVGPNRFAVGPDAGGSDAVTFYGPDGSPIFSSTPFPGFTGGLRTAVGDVNGDGIADLAIGSGPGVTATVVVIDGNNGSTLATISPFDDFTGGVFVSMGDMTGDGKAELVITPDQGGGPRVSIYSGATLQEIHNFFGLDDPNFRGALAVPSATSMATASPTSSFPPASAADLASPFMTASNSITTSMRSSPPTSSLSTIRWRNGAFVAVGDVDGDGFADLIIGAGPGGVPRVIVVSGLTLDTKGSIDALNHPMVSFFGGDPNSRNGVSVSAANLDNDSHSDVVIGAGSVAIAYQGKCLPRDRRSNFTKSPQPPARPAASLSAKANGWRSAAIR